MKLRIRGISLRVRVSNIELVRIGESGKAEDTVLTRRVAAVEATRTIPLRRYNRRHSR
jgi:hypothetical protein